VKHLTEVILDLRRCTIFCPALRRDRLSTVGQRLDEVPKSVGIGDEAEERGDLNVRGEVDTCQFLDEQLQQIVAHVGVEEAGVRLADKFNLIGQEFPRCRFGGSRRVLGGRTDEAQRQAGRVAQQMLQRHGLARRRESQSVGYDSTGASRVIRPYSNSFRCRYPSPAHSPLRRLEPPHHQQHRHRVGRRRDYRRQQCRQEDDNLAHPLQRLGLDDADTGQDVDDQRRLEKQPHPEKQRRHEGEVLLQGISWRHNVPQESHEHRDAEGNQNGEGESRAQKKEDEN